MSPISDIVGPSPVTSNGTETTEIEDEESMEAVFPGSGPPQPQVWALYCSYRSSLSQVFLRMADTNKRMPSSKCSRPTSRTTSGAPSTRKPSQSYTHHSLFNLGFVIPLFLISIVITAPILFHHMRQPLADELKDVH